MGDDGASVERCLRASFDELAREHGVDPSHVRVRAAPIDPVARFAYAEEERVVADAVPARRGEFATGRRLAHQILRDFALPDAPLVPGSRRAPRWPRGTVGSISHARGMAVVALALDPPIAAIGVDVESAEPLAPHLLDSVLTPRELARHRTLAGDPCAWAKLAFCAKECAYKTWSHALDVVPEFTDVEIEFAASGTRFVAQLVPRVGTPFRACVLRGSIASSSTLVLAAAITPSRASPT